MKEQPVKIITFSVCIYRLSVLSVKYTFEISIRINCFLFQKQLC